MGVELLLQNPIFVQQLHQWFDELFWSAPGDNQLKALYIAELVAQVCSGQLREHNDGEIKMYWNDRETRVGKEIIKEMDGVYPDTMGQLKVFKIKKI